MLSTLLDWNGLLKCKRHIYVCLGICVHLILEWIAIKLQDVILAHGSIYIGLTPQRRKTVQQTDEDIRVQAVKRFISHVL